MQLKFVAHDKDVIRLACEGQVTQMGLEPGLDMLAALLPGGDYSAKVLIDLEKTTYIDSSGVGWLIISHKRFVQGKGKMVLYNVPPLVMQILQMLKMPLIMNIAPNEAAARQIAAG
jgi:anti-anti-sigma factor